MGATAPCETIKRLVPIGVECFLTQLLDMGFFHCDPHPGNLLVREDDGRLSVIDFGLCSELEAPTTYKMTRAIVNLMNGNFDGLMDDAVDLGFLPADCDREAIQPKIESVLSQGFTKGLNVVEKRQYFQS